MKLKVTLDYETRSEADLKKVGSVSYAQHPSTEILCAGYKIDRGTTRIWVPSRGEKFPQDLADVLNADLDGNVLAHNAMFEQVITEYVLRRKYTTKVRPLFPRRWKCSAAKAAACALPRDLEGAALALKLPVKKNMEGRRLMLKHSKPRPQWTKQKKGNKYFEDPEEREKIYKYCMTDVDVELLLDDSLPDLSDYERQVWMLNQKMNLRGVRVDINTAKRIVEWVKIETKIQTEELRKITNGEVNTINQIALLLKWIRNEGVAVPNLQADTITKMLEMDLAPKVKKVLKIRQAIGKSSIKKYPAIIQRASQDGRVKDYSVYWGASTGREAGRGLQLQNLSKGKIKNTDEAIDIINCSTLDELRLLYGDVFEVFSSCIRGMIQASHNHKIYSADYSAIEARVLQWLAGDKAGLERFRKGIDSYVLAAEKIYNRKVDKETPEGYAMRDVGKRAELGCGFQMGGQKFYETCLKYGAKDVTPELCFKAVAIFRQMHPEIVKFWKDTEQAAINATLKPGRVFEVGKTSWVVRDKFLWCILPSGRRLAYYRPKVQYEDAPWGESFPKLYHWGSNPKTKQWENSATYGGRLVENITQAVARDICVNGMMNIDKAGYNFLFMVHDEITAESHKGSVAEFEKLITTLPPWATGLPITAKGWEGVRYAKR